MSDASGEQKIFAYAVISEPPVVRPAQLSRYWMEAFHERVPYRCLPLNIANLEGWEILNPASFTAHWNGKMDKGAIKIRFWDKASQLPTSHFGGGVLTFSIGYVFRTPKNVNLWVKGPANSPKDGIAALEGVVETDWASSSFTMNWKFTRPGEVIFEAGEPMCVIVPMTRGLSESLKPELRLVEDDPVLAKQYKTWSKSRDKFNSDLTIPGSEAAQQSWQKTYFQGKHVGDDTVYAEHQTKLDVRSFEDLRPVKQQKYEAPDSKHRPITIYGEGGRKKTFFVSSVPKEEKSGHDSQ